MDRINHATMTGLLRSQRHVGRAWRMEIADELDRLQAECGHEPELGYATRLAQHLWETHWKDAAPDWKPLPDLMGVLTQIDNAVANLKIPKQC